MRGLVLAACLGALCAANSVAAMAQSGAEQVDARAEVALALYAASATQAATERVADARLRAQAAEITRLQAQGASARSELIAAQERYVSELAERDRAYAQEIAVFRTAVTDIAATPEGAAALARFNAGDEIGALDVLDQLRAARDRARQIRANIESAAEGRRIATLALEARARGRLDTQGVIARYEEVTRLDPGLHWDWVELGRLYVDAGDLPQAGLAAERAMSTAVEDRSRGVALHELGVVQQARGDLHAARASFEQYQTIARRLAEADPGSTSLQADLSVSLARLGAVAIEQGDFTAARLYFEQSLAIDRRLAVAYPESESLQRAIGVSLSELGRVLIAQGDLPLARTRLEESLRIRERLARQEPSSVQAQRDVSVSLSRVGDLTRIQGDLAAARQYFERNLAIVRQLAETDHGSAIARRDLGVALISIGDVLMAQRELSEARARYEEGLRLLRPLAASAGSSVEAQRDVAIGNERLGNVLLAQGNLVEARVYYEERMRIIQRLAQADPSSAGLQRDLVVSYVKLQEATGDSSFAQRALDVALRMQQRGQLARSDTWMIEELRRRANQ